MQKPCSIPKSPSQPPKTARIGPTRLHLYRATRAVGDTHRSSDLPHTAKEGCQMHSPVDPPCPASQGDGHVSVSRFASSSDPISLIPLSLQSRVVDTDSSSTRFVSTHRCNMLGQHAWSMPCACCCRGNPPRLPNREFFLLFFSKLKAGSLTVV